MRVWVWKTDEPVSLTPAVVKMVEDYAKAFGGEPVGQHLIGPYVVEFIQRPPDRTQSTGSAASTEEESRRPAESR